jgi:MHS family proline/betaine transporter-like MFS transporter
MPGAMPTVATRKEAHELVATQDENPDLDVPRIMAQAAREGALASYA